MQGDNTLEFPVLLRLIDERSTAFRAAVASAPGLDVQVPTCPEWTLFDLAQHIGEGRRDWAATVAAGPAPTKSAARPAGPRGAEPLRDQLPVLAGSGDVEALRLGDAAVVAGLDHFEDLPGAVRAGVDLRRLVREVVDDAGDPVQCVAPGGVGVGRAVDRQVSGGRRGRTGTQGQGCGEGESPARVRSA
ncbi:maleylpyruvate isomerase N-terminal domain-containing protein [Kitasatospora sp. NPDC001683]